MGLSDMAAILLAAVPGGQYVSAVKAIPLIVILLIWARLLTWVDKDTITARLPRMPLNLGLFGGLVGCFLLALILPGFLVAMLVLILGMLVESGVYLALRHRQVGLGDLSTEFMNWIDLRDTGKFCLIHGSRDTYPWFSTVGNRSVLRSSATTSRIPLHWTPDRYHHRAINLSFLVWR